MGELTVAAPGALRVFSTCPESRGVDREAYPQRIAEVARWSEAAGCEGILVYTDNALVDPWLVSQLIIQATEHLCPLVAVQTAYMHPFTAARMVWSLAHLHGRRVYLNMVAGGFRRDLVALGDDTPHDERYQRLVEYTRIVLDLLAGSGPVSRRGRYYRVDNLRLAPPVCPDLLPGLTISGSSPAGLAAARALGAIAVSYPQRPDEQPPAAPGIESGLRIGIIARETPEQAWRAAHDRFPPDRRGQIAHGLAMRVSDSHWHRQLSEPAGGPGSERDPYWLAPFERYQTFCPYLVGEHHRLAGEIARYVALGFTTFILDIPTTEEELHHIGAVLREALALTRR